MKGAGEWRRKLWQFLVSNQRLLWLLFLFLIGVECGCLVFRTAGAPLTAALEPLLAPKAVSGGFAGAFRQMTAACFPAMALLAVLFLSGLSACGAPVALAVPLFFGMGLGLTEAYYFAGGIRGIGYVALLVLPHTLPALIALLMSCAEAARMSVLICRHLLPHGGGCGGLWPDFKLYLARFLLCVGLVFAAGALDTLLHMAFVSHFV